MLENSCGLSVVGCQWWVVGCGLSACLPAGRLWVVGCGDWNWFWMLDTGC